MTKKIFTMIAAMALLLGVTSCSLIPKTVEFGQKKVQEFPDHPRKQDESTRQAVALAADKAREAEKIATLDNSTAAVPAGEAAELAEAASRSLGPPSEPWKGEVEALKQRLDAQTAKYNELLHKFSERNDELAGKKIEGTGFLQIPYFVYLFGIFALLFIGAIVLKLVTAVAAAANPGVGLGLSVASAGAKVVSKGFAQVLKGGERFKERLQAEINDPELQKRVLGVFRTSHETSQDEDVQALIRHLTK